MQVRPFVHSFLVLILYPLFFTPLFPLLPPLPQQPLLLSRHYERHLSLVRHPHQHRHRHRQYPVNKRRHRQARHQNVFSKLVRVILCNNTDRDHRDRNRDGSSYNNNRHELLSPCFDLLLCDPILPEPASRSTIVMLPSATASPMRMPPILDVASVTTVFTREALSTNKSGKAAYGPVKADDGVYNIGGHGVSLVATATATSSSGPSFRTPLPPPPSTSPVAAVALVCVSDETNCCPGSACVINAMGSATTARSLCPLSSTTLPRTYNASSESPDIPSNACASVRHPFQTATMSSPSAPFYVWDWDAFEPQTRTLGHVPRSSSRRSRTPRPLLRSVSLSHSLPSSPPLLLATRGHFSYQSKFCFQLSSGPPSRSPMPLCLPVLFALCVSLFLLSFSLSQSTISSLFT